MPMTTEMELARGLEDARASAMRAGDAGALERMLDDELVYTHSFGDRDSKAVFMEKFRGGFFVYHELESRVEQAVLRGDVLVITGAMWSRATVGGEDRIIDNKATMVWARAEGAWRLLSFAPTPIKR